MAHGTSTLMVLGGRGDRGRKSVAPALRCPHYGGIEKRKPHYPLTEVKRAFADAATLNRTFVSKQGASALRMEDAVVVAVIQALSKGDFDKSMTSLANSQIWQDVYRPTWKGTELYVKFTLDAANAYLLISFKEA